MTRLMVLGTVVITLAGCVNPQLNFAPPTGDMRGVDQQKYFQDLADCTQQKRDRSIWVPNTPLISECLTKRGYTATIANT